MSRELIYLPAAVQDIIGGGNYYEELSPGRGRTRFETAFNQAMRQIRDELVTHSAAFGEFHRVFLHKFPYTAYYRLAEGKAVIVAVLYSRWDPKRIESTLIKRSSPGS